MFKKYTGKVVHIFGVISSYLGEIEKSWDFGEYELVRMKNPCAMNNEGRSIRVIKLGGYEGLYKDYVDIKIPKDLCIEIREPEKNGPLYAAYQKEIKRKKSDILYTPNDPRLQGVPKIATH